MGSTIDEEELCIELVENDLRKALPKEKIHSERVARGEDPPDFWLTVGTRKFAVEVTSLMKIVGSGPRELSEAGYSAWECRLGEQVTAEAKQQGVLKGTYILSHNQMPDLPTGKDQQVFVETCLQYIRDTMHKRGMQPRKRVWPVHNVAVRIDIYKLSDDDAVVRGGTSGHYGPKGNSWIESQLTKMLQKSVSTKRSKIEKKSVHETCDGVILALYDCFGFAMPHNFHHCINDVQDANWFHSIFVVQAALDAAFNTVPIGGLLRTREPCWYGETM